MVICLEQGADLHMGQLMPQPLTVSHFSKIQIGFTFLVQVVPEKGPLNGCMYTMSYKKRIPDIFSCNSSMQSWILIIAGRNVSQKVGTQKIV